MAQLATSILMPSFLQLVLGVSAGRSGLLILPYMAGTVIGSFSSGRIMRRTGPGPASPVRAASPSSGANREPATG